MTATPATSLTASTCVPTSGRCYGAVMVSAAEMSTGMRAALQSRADAWRFITTFAADWRAPLQAGDGYDSATLDAAEHRLALRMPPALREACALLGRRDDLLRNEDELLRPDELFVCEGALVYQAAHQATAHWGILLDDLTADDPPAFIRVDLADKAAECWEPWTGQLSVALVELVMSQTTLYDGDHLSDAADLPDGALAKFQPLPAVLPERHESAWFLGNDVLVHADGIWRLTVRARTSAALDAVRKAVPSDWVNR